MNRSQYFTALCAVTLGILTVAPKAKADAWDKKTIVTTTEAIEVPGVTLEPGKYVFKLANSSSDRHIVVIQNERMDHTYATILAIPNYRLQPTSKSAFLFWETPAGQPKALRAWFYPADNFGQEFAYPKGHVTRVAQVTHHEETTAPVAEAAPPAAQEPVEIAQNTPPPAPEPYVASAPAPPADTTPAPVENTTPGVIPQTASNLPLLALVGLLSAGLSIGMGVFVKRLG